MSSILTENDQVEIAARRAELQAVLERPLWRDVRHLNQAWAHVSVKLSGDKDEAWCAICSARVNLSAPGRTRISVLRALARIHYYKHKVWNLYGWTSGPNKKG